MASGPVEGGGLTAPTSQAEADAELDHITREWVDGMTPTQRRAFMDASNRRLARLKAEIQAEIQAEGITEQAWLARQRTASDAAWTAVRRPGPAVSQASDDNATE